jgi:hypothetical protein
VFTADKGNSIVIMYLDDYNNKVQDFNDHNNFTLLNRDPTKIFQNRIKDTIKSCQLTLSNDNKRTALTNMNPTALNIQGLPKVHKPGYPIRPIINWQGAPAYKLDKHLNKLIQTHIPLPNAFNVRSPTHLIEDLLEIPYKQGLKLVSFDIVNMYPKITTNELPQIIENLSCNNQIDRKVISELIKITSTILELQNYFTFHNHNYSQNSGLAMGAPSSAILPEVYLQHLEHTKIIKTPTQYNFIGYSIYVDDVLMVYDETVTDIHEVHAAFNKLAPTIKFIIEKETDNNINFLDISIRNKRDNLQFLHP